MLRVRARAVPIENLQNLAKWLETDPTVPSGRWFKPSASIIVCAEDDLVTTISAVSQSDIGSEVVRTWRATTRPPSMVRTASRSATFRSYDNLREKAAVASFLFYHWHKACWQSSAIRTHASIDTPAGHLPMRNEGSIHDKESKRIPNFEILDKDTSGTPGYTIRRFHQLTVSYTGKIHSGFPPHRHSHYEVFWVTEGDGLALIDTEQVTIKPMTLFFINPGEVHNFYGTRNMGGVLMQFSPAFIATLDTVLPVPLAPTFWRPRSHPTLSLEDAERRTINQIFANMLEDAQSKDSVRDSVIKAHLFLFFSKVRQFYLKRTQGDSDTDESVLTRRFRVAVRTDCPPIVTVKQFADRLGVSRSFLHSTVCRDTCQTPSHIIREHLMLEAKRRLLHSNADVAEIARQLGFGDARYFAKFFRRNAKVSPRRFRQRQHSSAG